MSHTSSLERSQHPTQQTGLPGDHQHKPYALKALLSLVVGALAAALVHRHIAPAAWWLGFLLWAALMLGWRHNVQRPWGLLRKLGPRRIDINLALDGARLATTESWLWNHWRLAPFVFRLTYLVILPAAFLLPLAATEGASWFLRLRRAWTPMTVTLRFEPPAYSLAQSHELTLSKGTGASQAIVAGTLMDLSVAGGEGWKALLSDEEPTQTGPATGPGAAQRPRFSSGSLVFRRHKTEGGARGLEEQALANGEGASGEWTVTLGPDGSWSGSTDLLAEKWGIKPGQAFALTLEVKPLPESVFALDLRVDPSPLPLVSLTLASPNGAQNEGADLSNQAPGTAPSESLQPPLDLEQGELAFAVQVNSETPLTQVELLVRTESGYRFTMPVGEFAGTDRLTFSAPSVRLQTIGIPFSPRDVLYVQARAQTFVRGLEGLSQELRFPVKSPQETRRDLRQQLEAIREQLKQRPRNLDDFSPWKRDLSDKVAKASQTATQLGRQSQPARALAQARDLVQRLDEPSEKQIHAIDARIRDALEALKRQEAQEQTSSWFMKMRSHLERLKQSDLQSSENRSSLLDESQGLRDGASAMKNALREMIDSPSGGLKLDEKQLALEALERDQTPENLAALSHAIEAGARDQALTEGQATLEEATQNLGGILQLLASARARRVREARERLEQADEQLEGARRSKNRTEQQRAATSASTQLDGTPQLGEAFNEALAEAQQNGRSLVETTKQGPGEELRRGFDKTQRSLANALAALQDEEQSDRDERSQEEGRRYRSAMDAMNAQGQLDSGWRKKIFDEISRLRKQGVPADADLIRYLESRLR